jgi:hypothetical protein
MNDYPIAYCEKAAGKIAGMLSFDEIVNLITKDETVRKWTEKARHLRANPPAATNAITYGDIKLDHLPQILPNALFTGADKTKAYCKEGSPWCMGEWDNLTLEQTHVLMGALCAITPCPAIVAHTLSKSGVWVLFRVDPTEKQIHNRRAVARHCKSIKEFASRFDESSVMPYQGRTLCRSDDHFICNNVGHVFVEGVDRYVEPPPKVIKPKENMSPSYRRACVSNAVQKIRLLSEGGRNKGINSICFSLHKTIGTVDRSELNGIEAACLAIGITRDELHKISALKRLRGVA